MALTGTAMSRVRVELKTPVASVVRLKSCWIGEERLTERVDVIYMYISHKIWFTRRPPGAPGKEVSQMRR